MAGRAGALNDHKFRLELLCAALARRRRLLSAAAAAAASSMPSGQGPQGAKPKPHWQSFSWGAHVGRLTESQFKLRYRLTVDGFYRLVDMMRPDLEVKDEARARLAKWGEVVEVETKLAMALRFLAGGDVLDLQLIYDVSKGYVYNCLWRVVDSINKHMKVSFPLHDQSKLLRLEAEFRAASRSQVWSGQVGAVDGVHFPMQAPTLKDVKDPLKYYVARKGEYAILCMAVCDAARRFTFWDMSQIPTTHDSLAWAASKLGRAVAAGKLPQPFFMNGDSAFALSPSMIVPSGFHDVFDFEQSSNRMPIECAFGILIQRFAVLYRPLRVDFERRAPLIAACMHLHNFCITERIADESVDVNGITMVQPNRWAKTPIFDRDGAPTDHLDIERGEPERRITTSNARTVTRDRLIAAIEDAGLERPGVLPPHMNRRKKRGKKRKAQSRA